MIVKIYQATWAATIVATALFVITGNLTMYWATVLGFVYFGIVFMGMISVLPSLSSHPEPARAQAAPKRESASPVAGPARAHTMPV